MAAARLAPVLSATSKMERICNIKPQSSRDGGDARAPFDDLDQAPALGLGERAGFLDAHAVADLRFALFVVSIEFFIPGDDLLKFGMREAALDPDDDGFRHGVRDDLAEKS